MPDYFVAKMPNGRLVGQFSIEDIPALVQRGEISPTDAVTESVAPYAELVRHGNANWLTVAVLLAEHTHPATGQSQSPPPLPLPRPQPSLTKTQRITQISIGFFAGAFFWALPFFSRGGYDGVPWLIFACFGLPVVSVIMAIIRATRSFGLGLLLASGLGWLILLSICGGLWR